MQIIDQGIQSYAWKDFYLDNIPSLNYWVFDLEATGLDFNDDRITQFGGIAVDGMKADEVNSFVQIVNPNKNIPPDVEELCGITNNMVAGAPSVAEVFKMFLQVSRNRVWVTQAGYEFDCPLLLAECERYEIDFPDIKIIDTKALFAFLHADKQEIFNTDYLLKYYGIDASDCKRHDALGDARIISRIFAAELREMESRGIESIAVEDPIAILKSMPGRMPRLSWSGT